MTDHPDQTPIDRTTDDEDLDADRPSGWAGVDAALGDTTNRPVGPDYGATDTTDEDVDVGTNAKTIPPREDDL